jgi:hypothetical protein
MEQQQDFYKKKYKFAADYGLILGLYLAVFYGLQLLFGSSAIVNLLSTLSVFGVPFLCFYLVKLYRDKACNGYIRFAQAWSFGVWLFLFSSLIMSVVYFIHWNWIDPDYISRIFNQSMIALEQMHYDEKALKTLAENPIPTPIQMVVNVLFAYIIGGSILALIVSPFAVKKDPGNKPTDNQYQPYQETNNPQSNQ